MGPLKSANSAKPSMLGSPVPGDNEADAMAKFMAQRRSVPGPQIPQNQDEAHAMDQYVQSQQPPPPPPEQPGMIRQGVDLAGRVLDYPGGFVRSGLAEAAGLASGKGSIVTAEDLSNAAKGKAPSSAEYLKRLGVSEGGSVETPLGKVTVRGAGGLALDIATDPLTALSKLAKEVPYIGKLINLPGEASEAAGEAIYKSGLKKVDAKLAAKGEAPISDALLAAGQTGSMGKLAGDVDAMANTMGRLRQGLYDRATQLGVGARMDRVSFNRAQEVLDKMKLNPGLAPAAGELEGLLSSYKQAGLVPLDVLSEWKTSLYDALPASAFNNFGKVRGQAVRFKQALASDMRQAIVETGNRAESGLGDGIATINEKWGTLLAAKKPMSQAVQQEASGSLGSWIDAALIGSHQYGAAGAKKIMDMATTTYAKTKFGKALIDAGRNGLTTAAARRAFIDSMPAQSAPQPTDMTQSAGPTGPAPQDIMNHVQDGQ